MLAVYLVATPKIEKFTEFYILDSEGRAGNYPKNLALGESAEVILGIRNHEAQEVGYRVVILLEEDTIKTINKIRLKHGEKWEEKISLVPNKAGKNMKLGFLLYKTEEEKPYGALRLFVNVYG